MEFSQTDFADMASFGLLRQWTTSVQPVFSSAELKEIRPLTPDAARKVKNALDQWVYGSSGNPQNFFYCGASSFDAALDPLAVTLWLERVMPGKDDEVIVIWNSIQAAIIPRDLFRNRWKEFCYSSCDAVDICSTDFSFVLRYDQNGIFSIKAAEASFR